VVALQAGGYVFPTRDSGSGSPLWGLRVIERTSAAGTEPPYLIDPQMLGMLYSRHTFARLHQPMLLL
jgi:hypothetical protein